MGSSFEISFNSAQFQKDLKKVAIKVVEEWADTVYKETIARLSTDKGKDGFTNNGIIEDMAENLIKRVTAELEGNAWFIIDEWGTGSEMDPDNPALDDYVDGDYWNPLRDTAVVVYRPKGKYTNIFGEERSGAGPPLEGKDMEKERKFTPMKPSHALKQALSYNVVTEEDYNEMARRAFRLMNWTKYLKIKAGKTVVKL